MFVKTQFEKIVNLTHHSTIEIDFSLPIHGHHFHQIWAWVETPDRRSSKQTLAQWKADINDQIKDIEAKQATKVFDEIFNRLFAGDNAFDLKAYINNLSNDPSSF